MTITDKQNTTGGQGDRSSQKHGAGVGIMAEQMMQDAAVQAIPAGYKQTEVGVIPDDWGVKKGRELFTKIQDGTHFSPKISTGGFLYITSKNIKRGYLDLTSVEYIDKIQHEKIYKRCDVLKNDILLTKDGVNTGSAALNTLEQPFSLLSSVAFLRLDAREHNPGFFVQQILSGIFQSAIKDEMSGNAITRLTLGKINNLKFYVPMVQEQTAIANVLSDTDALIGSLEQLVAKKQAIKSATMQQLLTGRTRLPAFALRPDGTSKGYKPSELGEIPEDWEVDFFSSAVWFQEGPGVRQYQFTTSGVKLLNGTNIDKGLLLLDKTQRFISEKLAHGQYSHFMIEEGDILIACSGVTIERFDEKVTAAKKEDLPLCLNTSTMRFKVRSESVDKDYIKNFLKSSLFKDQIGGKATGSAQLNFGPYHVNQVKIALSTKAEQTAIATILSDMDNELQALTQKLEKARAIKQGMMQQLLTGKIRLPLAVGA